MAQKFDSRQIISHDVLANILGVDGSQLKTLIQQLNKEINAPLRISATSPTADAKINFAASEIEAADLAAKNTSPVSSQIPSFPASTIDFQTGATTGGTFNISFPNSTIGYFRRIGFSLDASGTIQCLFSAEVASIGSLANAGTVFVKNALPIGWIDLEATAASPGRFKTAGSATNIIENKVGANNRVHRIIGGGGSGSGSGSGLGDDLASLTFKASFTDLFADLPSDSLSAVDYSAGKTDSATYDIVSTYHRLAYDASKTVTGTGTSMTLSGAPAFTIKAGDMLIVGSEARRISAITSQTVITIEAAFTTNPSAAACNVSQAVHTKDLNAYAGDGLAPSSAFSTTINQILLSYEDTSTLSDTIYDANTTPVIAYSASSDGTSFSAASVRPTNLSDTQNILSLPTSGTNLYLRFFANKTSGSGSVNVLGYKVNFHRDLSYLDGSLLNQAYCFTDGTGTELNCNTPTVVGGKTRIQLSNWSYPVGVNSGTPNGALKVYLNGSKVPRWIDDVITPNEHYHEIDQQTIELAADYSGQNLSVEIIQDVASVDSSDTNSSNIAALQEVAQKGFQNFVDNTKQLVATSVAGTPAAGTFYSSIPNRINIPDLTQNLKAHMAVERVMIQSIMQSTDEYGPNGEPVWEAVNDDQGLVRFVGNWVATINSYGAAASQIVYSTSDYVEFSFYGTGLNILSYIEPFAHDYRVSVDGGAEGANVYPSASASAILNARNYAPNTIIPITSGLTLGIHTIKIRNNNAALPLTIYGYEVLNESSSIKVNPGSAFVNGKKTTLNLQSTLAYNSGFESGTLGTRGGRVLVYQKADGSFAKAINPTNASAAYGASADHTNEEIVRRFQPLEFGAGRSDDWSAAARTPSSGSWAFTLDDGTTSLSGNTNAGISTTQGAYVYNAGNKLIFTFIGTGLDIVYSENAASGSWSYNWQIDGGTTNAVTYQASTAKRVLKIASGLPYGTHTFTLNCVSWTSGSIPAIHDFVVYQPKTPALPAGCMADSAYNIMANYTIGSAGVVSTGVLRKAATREMTYVGTGWTALLSPTTNPGCGWDIYTPTAGDYIQYTFFGTGFEIRGWENSSAVVAQLTVDGVTNLTVSNGSYWTGALTTSVFGNVSSLVASTGVVSSGTAGTADSGFSVTGLNLGLHTVKLSRTSGAGNLNNSTFEVITPIHSHKSNLNADLQNTLPVGSQGIEDLRVFSPLKDRSAQVKNINQAVGITSNPTTTSTAPVPATDMNVVNFNKSGRLRISYNILTISPNANAQMNFQIYIDGMAVGIVKPIWATVGGNAAYEVSDCWEQNVAPGFHKIEVYYWVSGAVTGQLYSNYRNLLVEEV